jgi:hypothetical protein
MLLPLFRSISTALIPTPSSAKSRYPFGAFPPFLCLLDAVDPLGCIGFPRRVSTVDLVEKGRIGADTPVKVFIVAAVLLFVESDPTLSTFDPLQAVIHF